MAPKAISIVTFLRSMAASWSYGGATRTIDPAPAIRGYRRALELVSPDRVDVESPWCRALIPLALVGYCEAAQKLERPEDVSAALARWRPVYRRWLSTAVTKEERNAFDWLETQP